MPREDIVMEKAKVGDHVSMHFTGMTEDRKVFATTKGREPVTFRIGSGTVIPGVENGVVGMQIGESRRITIPPEEGFGVRREQLVTTVKKEDFPQGSAPAVGKEFKVQVSEGKTMEVRVTEIKGNEVVLDANHPLAGKTLKFDVEVLNIQTD
jgi:FKBP-type peptidyl-prolyl cis-trans isomerase 2